MLTMLRMMMTRKDCAGNGINYNKASNKKDEEEEKKSRKSKRKKERADSKKRKARERSFSQLYATLRNLARLPRLVMRLAGPNERR